MRVLWIGECPWVPSSLGKVTYYLVKGLIDHGFDVTVACFAMTTYGMVYDGIECHPYANPLEWIARELKADLVVLYGTPYSPPNHEILPQVPRLNALDIRFLGYFVSESLVLSKSFAEQFLYANMLATPSRFVLRTVLDGIKGYYDVEEVEKRSTIIHHGVNTKLWNPGMKRKHKSIPYFVMGMLGKNMPRKNFGELIKAYSKLPPSVRKETRLMLFYSNPATPQDTRWNIGLFMEKYGVSMDEIITPHGYQVEFGMSEKDMVKLMSQLDAHVFATEGEAYGLPVLEASSLMIPNAATDIEVMRELWGNTYHPIKYVEYETLEGLTLAKPLADSIYEAMLKLYEDKDYRNKIAHAMYEKAREYAWERAVETMIHALENIQYPEYSKPLIEYKVKA